MIVILIIIVVIIYGNLIFRVNKTLATKKAEEVEITIIDTTTNESDFSITFSGKYKDPFKQNCKPTKKIVKKENKQVINKAPKISLQGIVGKTAMLKYQNELHFVQEGDSLQQYKIIRIYSDSLQIRTGDDDTFLKVVE